MKTYQQVQAEPNTHRMRRNLAPPEDLAEDSRCDVHQEGEQQCETPGHQVRLASTHDPVLAQRRRNAQDEAAGELAPTARDCVDRASEGPEYGRSNTGAPPGSAGRTGFSAITRIKMRSSGVKGRWRGGPSFIALALPGKEAQG